ncbi:MAG: P-type DNA transfer ATPase VirB11 [Gammaproteobacteria bacterium]
MTRIGFAPTSQGLLSVIKPWLDDPEVSEIMLNRPKEIVVEKKGKMQFFEVPALNERLIANLFQLIANENQQNFNAKQPLLSGSLLDGSRIQLILPPTAKHASFAIRRQVVRHFSLQDYDKQKIYRKVMPVSIHEDKQEYLPEHEKQLISLYSQNCWGEFIRGAIAAKKNIVISGGTSSGKTTFLNACLREISEDERIIVLEDTREITIPHPNQVNLLASKGEQGMAKISMQDLVQCALRLRPDRIIMGEIRGKEIMDFVSACATGHEGSFTTIHANNPRIAFMRMTQMYKQNNVPSMSDEDIMRELKSVIDIIIQLHKTPEGRLAQSIYYNNAIV